MLIIWPSYSSLRTNMSWTQSSKRFYHRIIFNNELSVNNLVMVYLVYNSSQQKDSEGFFNCHKDVSWNVK